MANVLGYDHNKKAIIAQMRNRFKVGDVLEVLSPTESFNKTITIEKLEDLNGNIVEDAKIVQQKLKLYTNVRLSEGDMLRAKI